jgi:hypothetical protein
MSQNRMRPSANCMTHSHRWQMSRLLRNVVVPHWLSLRLVCSSKDRPPRVAGQLGERAATIGGLGVGLLTGGRGPGAAASVSGWVWSMSSTGAGLIVWPLTVLPSRR